MAMRHRPIEVSASDLKNGWHRFLEQVAHRRQEVVVTRYGKPIAKLTPYSGPEEDQGIFGWLAGSVTVHDDLIAPMDEVRDADA